IENGVQLGLLIDRKNRQVHLYRSGSEPQVLDNPISISCDPELPGFQLVMEKIW
ncbi:MAG: Uma2 family endonuclease, partial [Cyanobacteria bacterium J06607_13]